MQVWGGKGENENFEAVQVESEMQDLQVCWAGEINSGTERTKNQNLKSFDSPHLLP